MRGFFFFAFPLTYVCLVNQAKLRNLTTRALSGAVFVVVVIGALFLGQAATGFLFLIAATIGLYELTGLNAQKGSAKTLNWLNIAAGMLSYMLVFLLGLGLLEHSVIWILLIVFFFLLTIDVLMTRSEPPSGAPAALTGMIYVSLPFALISVISTLSGEWNPWLMLGFFLILWTNDTGAYLTGMAVGRTKLFPAVSPNKTWEGLIGGIIFSLGVAWLLSLYHPVLDLSDWLLMAACVGVFGNIGDLYESYLKRNAGVKDSGSIMPGHGGVLDRFDGLLFSLPVFLSLYFLIHS